MLKSVLRRLALPLFAIALAIAGFAAVGGAPTEPKPSKRHAEALRAREQDDVVVNRAADIVNKDRAEFRRQTQKDGDLRILTANGRPVYACKPPRLAAKAGRPTPGGNNITPIDARVPQPLVVPSNVGTDTSAYINPTPFPLDQTFALHTRPGAKRILYLDFDGFTVHATDWNASNDAADDIVIPAFDTDNDPTTFSDAERTAVQEVWRRVAEDYAPYDVDVTTEDPGEANLVYDGPGDDHWGMRMVVGGWAVDVLGPGNDGVIGVALLDSFRTGQGFDSNGNLGSDTPAFCFANDILGYEPVNFAAEIAYTSSHEYGHTLGLQHDGDNMQEYYPGYTGWAPIMGSGDPMGVVQWSKGEYLNANNKEDDLSLIAMNYLPYIAFDHGTTQGAAVDLASGDTVGGVILKANDAAWYKIQAGIGQLTFTGSVASPNPGNLKMKLSLIDAQGRTVATSPTNNQMAATLSTNIAASGTYYIVVDGTSYLTPTTGFSDYDSIGRFSCTGTWQPRLPNVPPIADATGTTPTSGVAPLTVNFVGTASRDPDGIIASYLWDFGDGTPTSALASPRHVYATPGNYTASLTVADLDGATDTVNVPISVVALPANSKVIAVSSMSVSWTRVNRANDSGTCNVIIYDNSGRPMPNAVVNVAVSGLVTANMTARTDRSGKAVFKTANIPSTTKGRLTFTVTSAALTGYYYYPVSNKISVINLAR